MSYSPRVFLSLCTLEPPRNPKWGPSPSACAAGRQGYSKRWTPPRPNPTHSRAALQTPAGDRGWHHPRDGVGRRDAGGKHPLALCLENYGAESWEEESFSPSLSLGHHGATSQQLLASGSPCLLAGTGRGGREGGREGGSWCPTLPGWQVSGSPLGLFLPPISPFSSFPLPLVRLPAGCAPLSPPLQPSQLLHAGETRDFTGKG